MNEITELRYRIDRNETVIEYDRIDALCPIKMTKGKGFVTIRIHSLVSTKKSYEDFEIVDIQFVVSKFGTQRFDFIFAVCIRLFEKFSQSKKSLYSATY